MPMPCRVIESHRRAQYSYSHRVARRTWVAFVCMRATLLCPLGTVSYAYSYTCVGRSSTCIRMSSYTCGGNSLYMHNVYKSDRWHQAEGVRYSSPVRVAAALDANLSHPFKQTRQPLFHTQRTPVLTELRHRKYRGVKIGGDNLLANEYMKLLAAGCPRSARMVVTRC